MGMHSFGRMTEKQAKRLFFLKELGCLACFLRFGQASPGGDGHHAEDDAGRAMGHDYMIVLCPWHHVGKPSDGRSAAAMLESHGPSRHRHTVMFVEVFGTDLVLLERGMRRLDGYLDSFLVRPDV